MPEIAFSNQSPSLRAGTSKFKRTLNLVMFFINPAGLISVANNSPGSCPRPGGRNISPVLSSFGQWGYIQPLFQQ
jgi:hypothetical protein